MHFYSFWLRFRLLRNLGQEEFILKLSMWHETKQTNKDNPPSTNSNEQWSLLSLTSRFDFFFFSYAVMAWITTIPSTCDNVQSWLNSGELDFSFISSAFVALQSKRIKAYLLSILHLYVWEELLMLLGQSHPTHWYFTDGKIQFAAWDRITIFFKSPYYYLKLQSQITEDLLNFLIT